MPLLFVALNVLAAAPVKEKKAQTIKGWGTVIDPDRDCKLSEDRGRLTITVPATYHDLTYTEDGKKLNAPRVLQEVKGDFRVQVRVRAYPVPLPNTSSNDKHSFVSAGLLLWLDDKNYLRLDRAAEGSTPSPFIWVERFEGGRPVVQKLKRAEAGDTWLRIVSKEGTLTVSFSDDGDKWAEVHNEAMKLPEKVQVGVSAINTTTGEFSPTLEEFKVQKP
jgi:regulation of enolase protein 1 (concanavalin A-like superfamily)